MWSHASWLELDCFLSISIRSMLLQGPHRESSPLTGPWEWRPESVLDKIHTLNFPVRWLWKSIWPFSHDLLLVWRNKIEYVVWHDVGHDLKQFHFFSTNLSMHQLHHCPTWYRDWTLPLRWLRKSILAFSQDILSISTNWLKLVISYYPEHDWFFS
jgi:hypothetical protein